MRTNTTPVTMTRAEQLLALTIISIQLQAEQRIDDWVRANPSATYWSQPEGRGRMYTIIRDGKVVAKAKGADDDEARAQAFNVVFTNETAATIE